MFDLITYLGLHLLANNPTTNQKRADGVAVGLGGENRRRRDGRT